LNDAGWSLVADRIIRGICHDLNGRINSLSSLSYLLDTGSGDWGRVGPVFVEELERTEELSSFLRVLPDDEQGPRLLALGELLPRALHLVELQPGYEGVRWNLLLTPDFPPVRMDETFLLRSLVLLLTGVAEEAKAQEGRTVSIEGRAETGTLTVRPGRLGPKAHSFQGPDGEGRWLPENMEMLLAGVLKELGGDLTPRRGPGNGLELELRLPGLDD
jgi:hypothetical protein